VLSVVVGRSWWLWLLVVVLGLMSHCRRQWLFIVVVGCGGGGGVVDPT